MSAMSLIAVVIWPGPPCRQYRDRMTSCNESVTIILPVRPPPMGSRAAQYWQLLAPVNPNARNSDMHRIPLVDVISSNRNQITPRDITGCYRHYGYSLPVQTSQPS